MGTVSYPADGSQYSLTSCTPGTVQLNQSRPVPHLLPVPGEGQRHGGACPGVCVCVCGAGRVRRRGCGCLILWPVHISLSSLTAS